MASSTRSKSKKITPFKNDIPINNPLAAFAPSKQSQSASRLEQSNSQVNTMLLFHIKTDNLFY